MNWLSESKLGRGELWLEAFDAACFVPDWLPPVFQSSVGLKDNRMYCFIAFVLVYPNFIFFSLMSCTSLALGL
jgi:hypothetical protein